MSYRHLDAPTSRIALEPNLFHKPVALRLQQPSSKNVLERSSDSLPTSRHYDAAPEVRLATDGMIPKLVNADVVKVNSLHGQGVARLGPGLIAEAKAPDGVVEAIRIENAKSFALGVQWHPDYRAVENKTSVALFRAFGEACRERVASAHMKFVAHGSS